MFTFTTCLMCMPIDYIHEHGGTKQPTHQRRQREQPQLQLMPLRNGYNNISSSAKESGNDNCLGSRHPLSTRSCTCTWQTCMGVAWRGRGRAGTLQAALPAQRRGERHHQHLDLGLMLNNISINTTIFHMSVCSGIMSDVILACSSVPFVPALVRGAGTAV
jgi:hypothetical protein